VVKVRTKENKEEEKYRKQTNRPTLNLHFMTYISYEDSQTIDKLVFFHGTKTGKRIGPLQSAIYLSIYGSTALFRVS
jgi:hypothetical protein